MPGDLLSRPLIEIAADLRTKRVTARELVEAAISRHERFGERLRLTRFGRQSKLSRSLRRPMLPLLRGLRSVPCRACLFPSRTCSPLLGIPVSPGRAAGYQLILGSGMACWWRRCAGNSVSLWARPIWSSSLSEGPAKTVIEALPTTRGTRPRIVPRWFVERRRRQSAGRFRAGCLRQRHGGLGAGSGVHDRKCGLEGHARALVD